MPVRLTDTQTDKLVAHFRACRMEYEADPTISSLSGVAAKATAQLGFPVTQWAVRMVWIVRLGFPIDQFRSRAAKKSNLTRRGMPEYPPPTPELVRLMAPEPPTEPAPEPPQFAPDTRTTLALILDRLTAIEKLIAPDPPPARKSNSNQTLY